MREIEESVKHLRSVTTELSRSLSLLAQAERMGGFGFGVWDLETDEIWISEGIHEIYGLRRRSALQKPELVTSLVHPDDTDAVSEGLAAAIAGGQYDIVYRVIRPDGDERLVHSKAQHIEGEEGHPAILLGTIVDVTPVDGKAAASDALDF